MVTDDAGAIERMLEAARLFVEHGLSTDDSVFTPGTPIWTAAHADELVRHYVENLDTGTGGFFEKLTDQLAQASDGAVQLMAELLCLNTLPLADYTSTRKRANVERVLAMMSEPVPMPSSLDRAIEGGAFNGGVAFKTQRWAQLAFLVAFLARWKGFDAARRAQLLADPYALRDELVATPTPTNRAPAQQAALAYMIFPGTFEPIVSVDDKRRIRAAFAGEIGGAGDDVDRDLESIQAVLAGREGGWVDFYRPPWRERWQPVEKPSPESVPARRAWFVRSGEGDELVARWVTEGWISRPAAHLEDIDTSTDRDGIRAAVDLGYSGTSQHARETKVDEIETVLHRMRPDDVVLAVVDDEASIGRLTSKATVVVESGEGARLRRDASWRSEPVAVSTLPTTLAARLGARGVLEITEHLEALDALLAGEVTGAGAADLVLEPATEELADRLLLPRAWLQECVDLLGEQRQLILYGPPGTGKTFVSREIAHHLAGRSCTTLVQFHPAYSYEDFFEGYRPTERGEGAVGFALQPGPFRRLVDQARENPAEPHVLVIDEINRGNLAKIFGELYFLLEYRGEAIDLMYGGADGEAFTLPPNVLVIGTMNSADRSIALVDAAMRRRFAFVPLHPSEEPTGGLLRRWLKRHGVPTVIADLHEHLNDLIDDPDMKVGPSYFMRPTVRREDVLDRVWRTAILPLLEEHHYGDGVDVRSRYDLATLQRAVGWS
ncbi:McrB family protein [Actinomycetospora sp. CA-101289]|uniref:McrB family protein n=1 Tax=Actinomycetospora sp. CA-101289 TaxID=3239893 RepID=UPI003D97991F